MKLTMMRVTSTMIALILILCSIALVSCGNPTADEQPSHPGSSNEDSENAETPEDTEENSRLSIDYLPNTTYNGAIVNVMEWTVSNNRPGDSGNWVPWEEIDVDEGTGDPLDNAIYDRNGVVEETYDVVITKEYVGIDSGFESVFRAHEGAGDQAYQMITCRTNNISAFCLEGMMLDMNSLDYLHTEMPWWSQESVQSYTMGDALFFAAPEMLLRDKGATAAMFYNQKIADDHGIENLYTIAQQGEWTMWLMIELAEDIASDMDGDDELSSADDLYGLSGGNRDIPYFLFNGSNGKFAQINEEGYLELLYGDEQSVTVWQEILDFVMYSDFFFGTNASSKLVLEGFKPFAAERSMFSMGLVKSVNGLRNMQSMYGVLPIPKYDEYQENYSSLVWVHHDSVLGIPGSCVENAEMISVVLEHMSYLSYYDVYPIFYDTIILGKSARDQESKEMLELIFETRSFDPGIYWLEKAMHRSNSFLTLVENRTKNIASMWAGMEGKVNTAIEDFNKKIDELR